jgi:hypothetical protein
MEGGEPLDHQRRRGLERQSVRQRDGDAGVHHDVVRIAAEERAAGEQRNGNARADGRSADVLAESLDRAGGLRAEDGGELGRHRVPILAHERLGKVDARRADPDQRLAGSGRRRGPLDDLEYLGSTKAAHLDDLHRFLLHADRSALIM